MDQMAPPQTSSYVHLHIWLKTDVLISLQAALRFN